MGRNCNYLGRSGSCIEGMRKVLGVCFKGEVVSGFRVGRDRRIGVRGDFVYYMSDF